MSGHIFVMAPFTLSTVLSGDQTEGLRLHFPHGLPGFETSRQFVLRSQPSLSPFASLQSTDSADLCFLVVPVNALVADYSLWVSPEDLYTLRLDGAEALAELTCLAILTVPADGPITANLLAPVVVNVARNIAVQAVRADTAYSHRHAILALRPGFVRQAEETC
jgi:flagellar assembly factor FliW